MDKLHKKLESLQDYLKGLGSVSIAYSAGVDSTFLLKVAADVLGKDNVLALTVESSFVPAHEIDESKDFCEENGIRHIVAKVNPLIIPGIQKNPTNRCYLCKKELFTHMLKLSKDNNMAYLCEGSNIDDTKDYRPGMIAISELGIKSPLRRCDLTKDDIRKLSQEMGLNTWSKPSYACLASRFTYGEPLTEDRLQMVEKAEIKMHQLNFSQCRVRIQQNNARIELMPSDFPKILVEQTRSEIYDYLKTLGFEYISLDLKGYRTGAMNETIKEQDA